MLSCFRFANEKAEVQAMLNERSNKAQLERAYHRGTPGSGEDGATRAGRMPGSPLKRGRGRGRGGGSNGTGRSGTGRASSGVE